jgi:two-component system, NtrC family, response regulator AtoC
MKASRSDYFVKIHGPRTEVVRRLPVSGCVIIGSRDADIEIDEPSLSPRHAVLHIGARLAIEDRDSKHGTRLDGRTLRPGVRHPLALGEAAYLGALRLCVVRQQDAHSLAAPPRSRLQGAATAELRPSADAGAPSVREARAALGLDRSLERVAATDLGVLLLGDHGVGKNQLAELLHARSQRAAAPFVRLHCGALPEPLLESELFGGARDALPGSDRPGILERARGGTVFLDAVGELPLALQTRLLGTIERRAVVRTGELDPRPFDVRFIAACHPALEADVARGGFRRDLYLRLGTVRLHVPALRQRRRELRELAGGLVTATCRAAGIAPPPEITAEAWLLLEQYSWPGNLRELDNVIQQAVLMATTGRITPAELPLQLHRAPDEPAERAAADRPATDPGPDDEPPRALDETDGREQIIEALLKCAGNQTRAAKLLGISRGTLIARMESYALPRPRKRVAE